MHEYITSYIKPSYSACIDCNKRTTYICLKCNYCYSCHFKIEKIEKERKKKKKKVSNNNNDAINNKNKNNTKYYQRYNESRDISKQQGYPLMFVTYKIKTSSKNN